MEIKILKEKQRGGPPSTRRSPRIRLQVPVFVRGTDASGAEFIELVGDLSRHHGRQNRCDRHQDNQPDSDAKDSFPDGRSQHGSRLGDEFGQRSKSPADRAEQVL